MYILGGVDGCLIISISGYWTVGIIFRLLILYERAVVYSLMLIIIVIIMCMHVTYIRVTIFVETNV